MSPRLKPFAVVDRMIPAEVRDEAITVPPGGTAYWLLVDDATIELLARGICSEQLAQRTYLDLSWKRDAERKDARDKAGA